MHYFAGAMAYYRQDFARELAAVRGAHDRVISIVSLVPDSRDLGTSLDESARAFQSLPSKRLFLFCFFFSALIDQAIHSALREEHEYFDNLARYPKFVGILSMYGHNLHPAALLLVATLYTGGDERGVATEEFQVLARFFADDYEDFLANKYPALSGRLQSGDAKSDACRRLYNELSNALALLFAPGRLSPYSSLLPDIRLYEEWLMFFSGLINSKLDSASWCGP